MELYGTETNPKISRKICDNKIIRHFGKFNEEDYLNLLTSSSLLVIPFTFNNGRIENYRFSFPAKLPDSLACGVPVLIYGPPEMDAIQYCKNNHVGHIICEKSIQKLKKFIENMLENPKFFHEKAILSQQHARLNMSVQGNYQIFRQFFVNISTK
jgi:glycosyltransferase involved in cell wall biosynthesis